MLRGCTVIPLVAVIFAVSAGAQTQGVRPYANTGAFLVEKCRAVSVTQPTVAQVEDSDICVSYFEGFIDGKWFATLKFSCMARASYPEMVTTYLEFMKKNPRYIQMSKHLGVEAALEEKYLRGCSAK
jgi:hypothetical protein